jgi:hypothetical protein
MSRPHEKTQTNGTSAAPIAPATETPYLTQLKLNHRGRARKALRWRPKFLFALAVSCSFTFAAKAAGISYNTFLLHQRNDPEFARQVSEAEEEAADLLHAKCFKAVVEGQLEPVFFQGKVVGHFRKFDSRLAIELLRAHMPNIFKRPGAKVNINTGNQRAGGNDLIFDSPVMKRVMEIRQESLRKLAEKKAQAREIASNDATPLGTGPPAGVPPAT